MRSNQRIIGIIIGLVIVVGGGVIIASGSHKPAASVTPNTVAAVATSTVSIKDYMFGPAAIKVAVGTTVTWTNQDAVSHTVTADTSSSNAPSSMDIAKGESYSYTFKVAGTYTYHCFPHPYMHGSVIVAN